MTDQHIEESSAPLIEHLIELRKRLVWSLVAFLIAATICYVLRFELWSLAAKWLPTGNSYAGSTYLDPKEVFFLVMNITVVGGCLLSLPVIVYQFWAFVRPRISGEITLDSDKLEEPTKSKSSAKAEPS